MEVLDNPVWHALCGPQSTLAEGSERARRYRAEYAPFAAPADAADTQAWRDLAALVASDDVVVLLGDVEPGAGWTRRRAFAVHQMVFDAPASALDAIGRTVDELGDAAAMADLVARTEPGPWRARTHELGAFVGVHVDGRLVAMAGQRMQLADAVEISAVCTDPAYRGRGLARTLVAAITTRVLAAGHRPFLHVHAHNPTARRVYAGLGYRTRTVLRAGVYGPDA